MKKPFVLSLLMTVAAVFVASTAWAGRQAICHFPPGNPANFHTLTVSDNAANAHMANHGDLVGSCLATCEAICDDGDACTVDVESDPDQCICAAEPRLQVDCDDGNACTADACDSDNGTCTNDPGPLDGNICDDADPGTVGEACDNGFCDPPCPCFTGGDLAANGAVLVCGSNFPGFPNLTGMIWANGGRACSGEGCSGGSGTLACAIVTPVTQNNLQTVTLQQDQNCRALLLKNCPNPNLTGSSATNEESSTPFIDG